jgi:PKHD-type hydroxylase
MNYNQPFNTPDNYYWYQNIFTPEEISKLEEDLANLKVETARVGNDGQESDVSVRSSRVNWIPNEDKWSWLYSKIITASSEANKAIWNFDLHSANELIQYTEYHSTEAGHYTWHMDCGSDYMSHRKISITVQLSESDEYEGGDLELWTGGNSPLRAPRGKGVAVLFPSYMLHRVSPVTKGIRKSLVLWVGGSHFK